MNKILLQRVNMRNARAKEMFNSSYEVFSSFREALSLNNLKDFFVDLFSGIFTLFSCSESVLQSFKIFNDGVVVCKGIGVCCVIDLLYFRGWIVAVATIPEVLNLWPLLVASRVLEDWMMGFLILALELFVFLASCEMMSAVSTSLWSVDLELKKLKRKFQ